MDTRAHNLRLGDCVVIDRTDWHIISVQIAMNDPAQVIVGLEHGTGAAAQRLHPRYAWNEPVTVRESERRRP